MLVSFSNSEVIPLLEFEHIVNWWDAVPNPCPPEYTAFSPDGMQIAYFDGDCNPWVSNRDGTGEPQPLIEFPFWWTGNTFPRWGGSADLPQPQSADLVPCEAVGMDSGICINPVGDGPIERITVDRPLDIAGAPGWNPEGTRIVFSSIAQDVPAGRSNNVFVLNRDGSKLAELMWPFEQTNQIHPAWSPDGLWLLFHHEGNLAIMRSDGSEPAIIWDQGEGCSLNPQWSPDSQHIVLAFLPDGCAERVPFRREIRVITLRDTTLENITIVDGFTQRDRDWACENPYPVFSPDGLYVAYYDDQCRLWLRSADGQGSRTEVDEYPSTWGSWHYPQWEGEFEPPRVISLPEPRTITVCQSHDLGPGLCVMDDQNLLAYRMLENAALEFVEDSPPAWSPDGQSVVFATHSGLYIATTGEQHGMPISDNSDDLSPSWSPSGEWIAVASNCNLVLVNPHTGERRLLWEGAPDRCLISPRWAQDGHRIAAVVKIRGANGGVPSRDIMLYTLDGIIQVVTSVDDMGQWCPNANEVSFGSRGDEVVFFNQECEPVVINDNGSGRTRGLASFPWTQVPWHYPQTGVDTARPDAQTIESVYVEVGQCDERPDSRYCIFTGDGRITPIETDLALQHVSGGTWSPDGQRIAFTGNHLREPELESDIFIVSADGTNLVPLRQDTNDAHASWSPDGQWLAYHGSGQLFLTTPDGVTRIELVQECPVKEPQWSPDSQRIVASITLERCAERIPYTREVRVISLDGDTLATLGRFEHTGRYCPPETGNAFDVAFSPDGELVAFSDADCQTWIARADGNGDPEPIEHFPAEWTSKVFPQWHGQNMPSE